MKKIVFLSLILVITSIQVFAQTVSETQAKQVATAYFRAKTGQPSVSLKPVSLSNLKETALRGGGPAYYVFAPEQKPGFVIVSASEAAVPILAFSKESEFPADNVSPEVRYFLDGYREQLEEIREKRLPASPQIAQQWKALKAGTVDAPENGTKVGPYLTTTWNQSPYYNRFCPAGAGGQPGYTGCVATAMAQILKFWNYPVAGQGGFASYVDSDQSNGISGTFGAQIGGTVYNWQNMPASLNASSTQAQVDAIALLMYHCGIAVRMNYGAIGSGGSGAYSEDVPAALTNRFGFLPGVQLDYRDNHTPAQWSNLMKSWLASEGPFYYSGGSHAWVCDGYDDDKFLMNWGWGGAYNGAYYLNNLNPGGSNYTGGQTAVHNLRVQGCQPFFDHNLTMGNGTNLEAANYIRYYGAVPTGATVNFTAGGYIQLTPGCTISAGSTFRAWIQGCDGHFTDPNNEDRSQVPETVQTPAVAPELKVSPNPFSLSTTITYTLPAAQAVDIQIFNTVGHLVAQPVRHQQQDAGQHEFTFDASDLPTGVYFLVMQTSGEKLTKRLVLTK